MKDQYHFLTLAAPNTVHLQLIKRLQHHSPSRDKGWDVEWSEEETIGRTDTILQLKKEDRMAVLHYCFHDVHLILKLFEALAKEFTEGEFKYSLLLSPK